MLDTPSAGAAPSGRRAAGELESQVLSVLWDAREPLSPGDVRDRLPQEDGALSYSTVVTILTRLYEKGALARTRMGRAFHYSPVADRAGLAARRLTALLDAQPDRRAVLSRFVHELGDSDEALLRELLAPVDQDTDASATHPAR